ncbi:MAG: hypothetical protein IT436_14085 [Phycisphaerales bacterium]|nr:hypothetical protein [Phycisphaerales bacterium]
MRRTHSDYSRVQAAWADDSTRAAIDTLLLQLADAPDGTTGPGPEELAEALESHPGADRTAVVDYFAYRPAPKGGA